MKMLLILVLGRILLLDLIDRLGNGKQLSSSPSLRGFAALKKPERLATLDTVFFRDLIYY